jgi:riboflavin synthase
MFTGIVKELGKVEAVESSADGARLRISAKLASELGEGDSVSVNGACLTATSVKGDAFEADVMQQTLGLTTLGELEPGSSVNLELPLRATDRLGGHFVQGHVDGVGGVWDMREDGFALVVTVGAPPEIMRYVIEKGSIAVDGVSLTVSALGEDWFQVSLIPETLERTILGEATAGTPVNLEVDVLAKYIERLVPAR